MVIEPLPQIRQRFHLHPPPCRSPPSRSYNFAANITRGLFKCKTKVLVISPSGLLNSSQPDEADHDLKAPRRPAKFSQA